MQEIKSNVKNTYIKKISSLLNIAGENLQFKDSDSSDDNDDNSQVSNPDPNKPNQNKKGEKNVRQSAKYSRLRKKIYIELLEKKVNSLQSEIKKSFEQIECNQSNLQ